MKGFFLTIFFFAGLAIETNGQEQSTDSLKQLLKSAPADSNRIKLLLYIANSYYFTKPDSCLIYSEEALTLARNLNSYRGQITALNYSGEALRFLGDYPRALKMQLEALELNRKKKDLNGEAGSLGFIGFTYVEFREYRQGLQYLLPAREINRQISNQVMETFALTNIGNAYDLLKIPDSALFYQRLAYNTYTGMTHGPLKSLILSRYGNAFAGLGNKDSSLTYYHLALKNVIDENDRVNKPKIEIKIAELYETIGQYDSSLYFARRSFINGQRSSQSSAILETSDLLVRLFRRVHNSDSALYYQDISQETTNRIYGPQKFKELQLLMLAEQQRQQENIREEEQFRNKIKYIALLSILGIFLLLAFLLIRINRNKQKANNLLKEQKDKIEHTLDVLNATQKQLIQSEKMASLGELTAGIAHEIQNPLNFVNNFSEVNSELLTEMKDEMDKGHLDQAKSIANDVINNQEKINHHGKRADAIVKGMLQHSRSSSGVKEPTDINALAEEYLRLAYHGLRAKDKLFNATLKTDFDESMGNISIIPQDMGRVILNLLNNAFYAVSLPSERGFKDSDHKHEPTVWVSTKKMGDKVLISVKDNGPGIPQKVLNKIFQPFFTTKPTGQGTGLGLSLSYDIVKAHGGELKVETEEGKGTIFIIQLPVV